MQKSFFITNLLKNIPCIQINLLYNEISCSIPATMVLPCLFFLRDNVNCQFKILSTITVIDYPEKKFRFEIIYDLLSLRFNNRIRLKIFINELTLINSVNTIFLSSNWVEREIFDLFGIFFINHPDLRRILTDYGFDGFPLRKDFPLNGFIDVRYDIVEKRVIYEKIELNQTFKFFKFYNSWL